MNAPDTSAGGPVWVTPRLRLVALDRTLARLQVEDRKGFFRALNVQPEAAWPPVASDEPKLREKLELLLNTHELPGWRGWVFITRRAEGVPGRLAGNGGFFGPPDGEGVVEIGYSMLPSFREQGLATEAVEGLAGWAFSQPGVKQIRARTMVSGTASRRVLEKSGFALTGETSDPEAGPLAVYTLLRKGA